MPRLKVLFVCSGNACRSQMAEGWARHLSSDVIEPYSAGVTASGLAGLAVRAMEEVGVDISKQKSKTFDDVREISFDVVVTLCMHAELNCPAFPGTVKRICKEFPDPPSMSFSTATTEGAMVNYRKIRDQIRDYVEAMPDNLALENPPSTEQ